MAHIIRQGQPAIPNVRSVLDDVDPGAPQTILLLGSDRRYGSGKGYGLSDTMILVRLDPSKGATAVMNIPRAFGKNSGSMPQYAAMVSRSFSFSSAR